MTPYLIEQLGRLHAEELRQAQAHAALVRDAGRLARLLAEKVAGPEPANSGRRWQGRRSRRVHKARKTTRTQPAAT